MQASTNVVVALLGTILAGCLAPPAATDGQTADPMAAGARMLFDFAWPEKSVLITELFVDLDRLQATLPPGFVATEFSNPLAPNPTGRPTGYVLLDVAESPHPGVKGGASSLAFLLALVERPHVEGMDLAPMTDEREWYVLETYGSGEWVERLRPLGYNIVAGTAKAPAMPGPQDASAAATVDDAQGRVWSFDLAVGPLADRIPEASGRGWHATSQGLFILEFFDAEAESRTSARTACDLRAGSMAAELAGADCGHGRALAGYWHADASYVMHYYPGAVVG